MSSMFQPFPTVRALVIFGLLLISVHAQSPQSASSSRGNPVLVELFTSEGCSSCPPADLLLEKLDKNQPVAGAQLIVLSEHVTYWDHDGWKDPNSSASLTDRQNSYETALGSATAYTPQMIVDGIHELHLRDSKETEDVLTNAGHTPKLPIRISGVAFNPGNPATLRTRLEIDASNTKHGADVYLALALDHVESQVLRGENGGKHLVHVAVVQQLSKVGKLQKGSAFAQEVELKLKSAIDSKNLRIVAFAQERGPGQILGAAQWTPAE